MAAQTPEQKKLYDILVAASKGSYDREAMDVQDHVLYDTNLFQDTTVRPETSFFQQPIGSGYGAGGSKGLTETNMDLQGQIPNSQYFVLNELSFAFIPGVAGTTVLTNTLIQAYVNIIQNSNIRVILAGRSFDLETPGSVFVPPVFLTGLASAANAIRVGEHTSSGWMSVKIPIVIEGGAAFNVKQTTRSAVPALQTILDTASDTLNTSNSQMQCRMKGTLIRYK